MEANDDNQTTVRRAIGFSVLGVFVLLIAAFFLYDAFRYLSETPPAPTAYQYTIKQSASTTVSYFSNSFYTNGPTIDNSAYVSELTDTVAAHFSYNFNANKEADLSETYEVRAQIQASYALKGNSDDSSNVWTRDFQLVKPTARSLSTTSLTERKDIVIPYAEYKKISNDFRSALALPTTSKVVVTFTAHVHGVTDETPFDDVRVSTVSLTLDDQIYQPDVTFDKEDSKQILPQDAKQGLDRRGYIEFIVGGILALGGLSLIVYGLRKQIFKSPYRRELDKIYRYHDGIIVRTSRRVDMADKEIVPMRSFNDMLDLEEELKLPIIASELNNESTAFMILHTNVVYRFILGREPLSPTIVKEALASLDTTPENTPPQKHTHPAAAPKAVLPQKTTTVTVHPAPPTFDDIVRDVSKRPPTTKK